MAVGRAKGKEKGNIQGQLIDGKNLMVSASCVARQDFRRGTCERSHETEVFSECVTLK